MTAQRDTQFRERLSLLTRRETSLTEPFLYGVKSTGIFCLPHCPSKLPNPENIFFFENALEATKKGFRPCKRCRPNLGANLPIENDHLAIYEQAKLLVQCGKVNSVSELALSLHISQKQLNRILKKATGQTARKLLRS